MSHSLSSLHNLLLMHLQQTYHRGMREAIVTGALLLQQIYHRGMREAIVTGALFL